MSDKPVAFSVRESGYCEAQYGSSVMASKSPSPQPRQDARQGYISPYPPLPTSTTQSSGEPTNTITSRQAEAQQSLSASSTASSERDPTNDRHSVERVYRFLSRLQVPEQNTVSDAKEMSQAQKQALIAALNERRVNTLPELRRIERIFADLGHSDLTEPMTSAWVHYVNSNNLLTELRGLTRNYPFSSDCLEEGKRRVHQDPASNRSWNYCWLVLAKIHTDGLISTHAHSQAVRPEMWGGRSPPADAADRLAQAFAEEWRAALAQLLRYWESAPTRG